MEISQVISQHVIATLLVLLVGIVTGGGLGFLLAWLSRLLFMTNPGLRPVLMMVPGRTVLFSLVLFFGSAISSTIMASIPQGLGAAVSPVMAFALLVCFLIAVEALNQWLPDGPAVRWTGLARTLAVASGVIVAIGENATGSGILGYARIITSQTFKPDAYWTALGVVMGVGLLFDLGLGTVQMLLAVAEKKKATKQVAPSGGE
jgi:hypothetical protein